MEIRINRNDWETLRVRIVGRKWSTSYLVLCYWWQWNVLLHRFRWWQRWRDRALGRLFRGSDAVLAPALSAPSVMRQVLLRNTAACARMLREAEVVVHPLEIRGGRS